MVALVCVIIATGLIFAYCVLSAKLQRAKRMMKYLAALLTIVILNAVIVNIMPICLNTFAKSSSNPKSTAQKLSLFAAIYATASDFMFLGGYLLVLYSTKLCTACKKVTH